MNASLAATALVMGLFGSPHCVAMCGAACGSVVHVARRGTDGVAVLPAAAPLASLHLGRLAGYALGGAAAASSVSMLGVAGAQFEVLRVAWTLLHVAVLAWGVALAVTGRQPAWHRALGRGLAARLQSVVRTRSGLFATGMLWVTMPCGMLYSALMLASLGNSAVDGALLMLLFALGGAAALMAGPWLWQRLAALPGLPSGGGPRRELGLRLAGVLLAAVAVDALWRDLGSRLAAFCA